MNEISKSKDAAYAERSQSERKRTERRRGRAKKPVKKLKYNHREVGALLLRAKRTQNAVSVLTLAKTKLANIKRNAASGQYDRREVANAVSHAKRMVQCAETKVRNLKEEERERKRNSKKDHTQNQKHKLEREKAVKQKRARKAEQIYNEQLAEIQRQKRKQQELEQRSRKHRAEEYNKVTEANMKYVKGQSDCSAHMPAPAVLELTMERQLTEEEIERQLEREESTSSGERDSGSSGESDSTVGTVVDVEAAEDLITVSVDTVAVSMDVTV